MSCIIRKVKNLTGSNKTFSILILLILLLISLASYIQTDFGNIDITYIDIINENGTQVTGKLYKPLSATNSTPQAAVLLLHGWNNDKDTEGPAALELAKRGFVALALDEINHGNSGSESNRTVTHVDPTQGANAAYRFLETLGFVDKNNMGIVGHSMGQSTAAATAKLNPNHKAIVFQAFGPINITEMGYIHNYLQLWPRFEDSSPLPRDEWITSGQKMIKYNVEKINETYVGNGYGVTYGDFNAGTAQRYTLIDTTHPGGTWNTKGVQETVAWMLQALKGESETKATTDAHGQTYYLKEVLLLFALILLIFSSIPLVDILLNTDYFSIVKQETPTKVYLEGGSWWKAATINAWIGGLTIMILPAAGTLLFASLPLFNLMIGNGWALWFVVNAFIASIIIKRWLKSREDVSIEDLGAFGKDKSENDRRVIWRTFILTTIIFTYFYIFAVLAQSYLYVEFRYMWSFFRVLSPIRFIQFLLYLIPIYYFFKNNAGLFLFGQARVAESSSSIKTILKQWLYNSYNMVSALIILWIIEFIPMFLFGTAPLLGGFLYFWLIGIFLMSIIPEFLVIYLIMTIFFKNTGRIYLGSFIGAMITTWVLATGVM